MPGLSFHGTTAVFLSSFLVRFIPTGQVQVFICPFFGPISVLSGPSCPLQYSSSTLGFTFPTKVNSPASRSAAELRAKVFKVTTGRLRVDSTNAAVEFSRLIHLPHRHIFHNRPALIHQHSPCRSRVEKQLGPPALPLAAQSYPHRRAGGEGLIRRQCRSRTEKPSTRDAIYAQRRPSDASQDSRPIRPPPPS